MVLIFVKVALELERGQIHHAGDAFKNDNVSAQALQCLTGSPVRLSETENIYSPRCCRHSYLHIVYHMQRCTPTKASLVITPLVDDTHKVAS